MRRNDVNDDAMTHDDTSLSFKRYTYEVDDTPMGIDHALMRVDLTLLGVDDALLRFDDTLLRFDDIKTLWR